MGLLGAGTDLWEWLKTLLQGNEGMVNTTTGEVGQSSGLSSLFSEGNLPLLMAAASYFQNAFPGRTQYKQSTIGNISKGLLGAMQGYTGMQDIQSKQQQAKLENEWGNKPWTELLSPITRNLSPGEPSPITGEVMPTGAREPTGEYGFSPNVPVRYLSSLSEAKKLMQPEKVAKKTRKFEIVGVDPNNPNNDLWATTEDGNEVSERVSRPRSPEKKVYHPYKIQKKVGGRVVTDTVFDEETKALRLKNGWTEGVMEKPEKPVTEQGEMEVKKTKKDMIMESLNRRYLADERIRNLVGEVSSNQPLVSKLPSADVKIYNDVFNSAMQYGKTMDAESSVDKALTDWHSKKGVKKLDVETAKSILMEAGGDKERARKIAKDRGYTF